MPDPLDVEQIALAACDALRETLRLEASGDAQAALAASEGGRPLLGVLASLQQVRLRLARGLGDRARTIEALQGLLLQDARDPQLHGELGDLLCQQGDYERALPHLRIAAPVLRHERSAIWNYTATLALSGFYHELLAAVPLLDSMAAQETGPYTPYRHVAAARLALLFDRARAVDERQMLEASPRWLQPQPLIELIGAVIAEARPFSLVCIDQELSTFFSICSLSSHLVLRPQEVDAVAAAVWPRWFDQGLAQIDHAGLAGLGRAITAGLASADAILLPGSETLRLDNMHFGFLCSLQQAIPEHPLRRFGAPSLVRELHKAMPFLRSVLHGLPFLGVIGPYATLAERLGRFCGIERTQSIVAGVGADRVRAGPVELAAIETMLEQLVVPHPGAVFLVSLTGPVAAAACGRIRALGGIALDLGSIAASWARS